MKTICSRDKWVAVSYWWFFCVLVFTAFWLITRKVFDAVLVAYIFYLVRYSIDLFSRTSADEINRHSLLVFLGLLVAGITISLGWFLVAVIVCIVVMRSAADHAFSDFAALYAYPSIQWVLANQIIAMLIFYLFLKWVSSGKMEISAGMKSWSAVFVLSGSTMVLLKAMHLV